MGTKIVVHSNTKRLVQVVGAALLIAAALTGLKRFSVWWKAPERAQVSNASGALGVQVDTKSSSLIMGQSTVVDADTLEIQGARIRLEGIDAPEASQRCGAVGKEWACGQEAALALADWLGDRPVSCRPEGQDRYQRTLARCFVGAEDVQAWLVLNGWALAYREYSKDYVAAEEVAQSRKAGLWRGDFVPPWDWREGREAK